MIAYETIKIMQYQYLKIIVIYCWLLGATWQVALGQERIPAQFDEEKAGETLFRFLNRKFKALDLKECIRTFGSVKFKINAQGEV